jgi:hypothetical protein
MPTTRASAGAQARWNIYMPADRGARRGAASRRLGTGIKPSRCARKLDHFGDVPA